MAWTTDTVDRFTRITGFDFTQFLTDYYNFNRDNKPKIYNYYEDRSNPDGESFNKLDTLRTQVIQATTVVKLNRESFIMFDDWELFEDIEDISRKLNTIYNSSKYLRSAISTDNFDPNPVIGVTLRANQTLERLARDLGYADSQNEWTDIFLNNQLIEEDYTNDGGILLKVTFQGVDPLVLDSVVDNINDGDKVYGLDIQAKLQFSDDDLTVLDYDGTLDQTVGILAALTKGQNPEYPTLGFEASIAIGSTYGAVAFPVIFRQLYQNFATDDSFKSFAILDAELENDALKITYRVQTRTDEIQDGSLII